MTDCPVAILGMGGSGRAVAALLDARGHPWEGFDERRESGYPDTFSVSRGWEKVIVSPGLPAGHRWVTAARAAGLEVIGEWGWAAEQWPGEMWAVTGTNGKTTLTLLLEALVRKQGRAVRVAGNIGLPLSRSLLEQPPRTDELLICEVSSFQAANPGGASPEITFWTNFAEDHLDWHGTREAYLAAKVNLLKATERKRGGRSYLGASVERSLGENNTFRTAEVCPDPDGALVEETPFARWPQRENAALAYAWWRSAGGVDEAFRDVLRSFRLPPHRLSICLERAGVTFWDDSKATNFAATEAALAGFPEPVRWLGGGKDKGDIPGRLVEMILNNVKAAYLFGETGPLLRKLFAAKGVPCQYFDGLEAAVKGVVNDAEAGEHVVLSPGFSSLDQFSGYAARGKAFREALNAFLPTLFT